MLAPAISIFAAVILAGLYTLVRFVETNSAHRYFEDFRARLDVLTERSFFWLVMGGIPDSWRQRMADTTHQLSHATVQVAVSALRAAERPLARLSYKMRVSAPKRGAADVSPLLKAITPSKIETSQNTPSTI